VPARRRVRRRSCDPGVLLPRWKNESWRKGECEREPGRDEGREATYEADLERAIRRSKRDEEDRRRRAGEAPSQERSDRL
jgi:hypothetical protein